MKYILCDIETKNIKSLEELIDYSIIKSISITGKIGFESPSLDILELSFSRWIINIFPQDEKNIENVKEYLIKIFDNLKLNVHKISTLEDNQDYIIKNQKSEIINISNFSIYNNKEDYIYNNQFKDRINILIEHSMAFGTGHHETTSMCLSLISDYYKSGYFPRTALDLGTGTGILAIAIAKLFKENGIKIIASDIDQLSLKKADDFIEINEVSDVIDTVYANSINNHIKSNKYSLIVSNILLNTLLEIKQDIFDILEYEGTIILSGILISQKKQLIDEYTKIGFTFIKDLNKKEWSSILFQKVRQNINQK